MATLNDRLTTLERKAKHAALRDDRPWEVIFAESCAEMTKEVDAFLKPFGGDPAAYLDYAEEVNNEAMRKIAR